VNSKRENAASPSQSITLRRRRRQVSHLQFLLLLSPSQTYHFQKQKSFTIVTTEISNNKSSMTELLEANTIYFFMLYKPILTFIVEFPVHYFLDCFINIQFETEIVFMVELIYVTSICEMHRMAELK